MKISYNWIKEYIDPKLPVESLAAILTMSGSEVKGLDNTGKDSIMDIEITPNRSDCLSYIGMARELKALTGRPIKLPPISVKEREVSGDTPFTVEIADEDICSRYTARLIKDVSVKESPEWLKEKITAMGLRPVNNVVDITNFVLFETGQPLHAFDYDLIKDAKIVVRKAKDAEKIITIDNMERRLEKEMLVIADSKNPIAIAGVMGGIATEVNANTKNILLESAYFEPTSIRRTSFKFALMSESSYRFERGVDRENVLYASDRAALLVSSLCQGKIANLVDTGKKSKKIRSVTLRIDNLNKILCLKLNKDEVKKILDKLSINVVQLSGKGTVKALIPSFRGDIQDEVDLIEEVARIYGYDRIEMTIPGLIPSAENEGLSWKAKKKASDCLTSLGLSEVITYGLVMREEINSIFGDGQKIIGIKNPLSAEQEVMRPSLIPGVVKVVRRNINRGMRDQKIFEMGKMYKSDARKGYDERMSLCLAITGAESGDWQRNSGAVTFYDLKGVIELLFKELGLKGIETSKKEYIFFANNASMDILYRGKWVGRMGLLSNRINNSFDLGQNVFVAEINFDIILSLVNLRKSFKDIPKYPSVKRDISLIAGGGITYNRIRSLINEKSGELVEKIELFDKYTGKQIPDGFYGLTIRIEYRDKTKTLTTEEVDKAHSAIRQSLADDLGVTFR